MVITFGVGRMPGPDLRAERIRHSLRAIDVARELGLSRERTCQLERAAFVSPERVDEYLLAVARAAARLSQDAGR